MDINELQRRIAELEAKNERLVASAKAAANRKLTFKVGEKGGAMIAGLGRFPTTLYYGQWKRLIAAIPDFEEWLEEQKEAGSLKLKDTDE